MCSIICCSLVDSAAATEVAGRAVALQAVAVAVLLRPPVLDVGEFAEPRGDAVHLADEDRRDVAVAVVLRFHTTKLLLLLLLRGSGCVDVVVVVVVVGFTTAKMCRRCLRCTTTSEGRRVDVCMCVRRLTTP